MNKAAERMDNTVSEGTSGAANVPSGYKRTEVGLIPEDWQISTIGSVAEIKTGGTPSTQNPTYWNGPIPWCVPTDVTRTPGKYLSTTERRITESGLANSAASMLPPGSLLLCTRATVGDVRLTTIPICTNQGFKPLVCKEEMDNEFLYYVLLPLKPRMAQQASGSTFLEISKRDLASIQLQVPPPAEQSAIAEALSNVDNLLELLEALIAKKQAIKQATMQQLLTGKTRLPGFSGKWETRRLRDLGPFSKGRGIKREDISDTGLPCIRYGELYTRYKDYILSPVSRIPPSVASESLPIKKGDLLFAGSGETAEEIGTCAAYLGKEQAYASGDVIILTPSGQNSIYLGHLMNHPSVATQKARMGQGNAVVHISAGNLAQVTVHLPPLTEQTAIAAVLCDMDAEMAALEQRRDKCRNVKQGMMQQLLTGQVRLI